MSNNLIRIETRNQRRVKNAKPVVQNHVIENTEKVENEHNNIHAETDEEFQQHQYKKVKTENNSSNKIAVEGPVISSKKNLTDSLQYLRECASDTHIFENNQENLDRLSAIIDYKYNSQKGVFTKDVFERKLKSNITPDVFTKKNSRIRLGKPETPFELAFEKYLALVVQLYYKANYQSADILTTYVPEDVSTALEDQKILIPVKKPGKRGRKAKPKPLPEQPVENDQNSENTMQIEPNVPEIEDKEEDKKDEGKALLDNAALSKTDTIDFLVSPLKADYVFEKWNPKEIAIFEAALCKYGKEFSFIQFLVKTKNMTEVIEFYFAWKNTSHYKTWKYYKNLGEKLNYNSWL